MKSDAGAWYALRRTLPPWNFEENLAELVALGPRYGIDEVVIKVDTEEFSHGLPSLRLIEDYIPRLHRTREALEAVGIIFSINPWVTLVHGDRGRDCRGAFPDVQFMVGHDGIQCRTCACPLSRGWREHTLKLWRLYASTRPAVLWVEDDIRTFNHAPVRYGCFCDGHLDLFNERAGSSIGREELVAGLLAPGAPHPYRNAWLDLQGTVMVEVASLLEGAIHEVSPETKLGLMSSGPDNHALEGRNWEAFAAALSGGGVLVSRPPLGSYSEVSLRGLYYSADSIKLTRFVLPGDTIEQSEVENIPFTGYSKSNRFSFLQMALSFALGCDGVTMNLFDHCGTPMEDDPDVGRMLRERKPYLQGLARRCARPGRIAGVGILHHDGASRHQRLSDDADYKSLRPDGYAWVEPLESLGIATTYQDSKVVAVSGQVLRAYDDRKIESFLRGGMLIDLVAAQVLAERGFGEHLGASIRRTFALHGDGVLVAEEFFDEAFGGAPRRYLTLSFLGGDATIAQIEPDPAARVVSRLVDPDAEEKHPFLTVFENRLGGRVALMPLDMNEAGDVAFLNPLRRIQMANVLKWLARDALPLLVEGGVYPLTFRTEFEGRIVVSAFNLSLDDWPFVRFSVFLGDREPRRIEALDENGEWAERSQLSVQRSGGHLILEWRGTVSHQCPVVCCIHK